LHKWLRIVAKALMPPPSQRVTPPNRGKKAAATPGSYSEVEILFQ
jgi:hypothetical protein